MKKTYLDLEITNNQKLFLFPENYNSEKKELEEFLKNKKNMETETFAKKVMFSHELKANNNIEGYSDDIELIRNIIAKKCNQISDLNQKRRILNLYHGYNYILKNKEINKETLKELYKILSKNLLEPSDISRMGEYYRKDKVYILKNGRIDIEPYEGVQYDKIDEYMENYFQFLKNYPIETQSDIYIKSQILHYYFVYIHPYFDVNGRTSRTMSMWYLLNNKAYPYIIFNRGISFKSKEYNNAIIDVRKYNNVTFFVKYMLETVILELEKEHIMQQIANNTKNKLDAKDYQAILYFLTMKSKNNEKNILDFASFYNRYNDKKSAEYIYQNIILPLLDKEILDIKRETPHKMFNNEQNKILILRTNMYDKDTIKRIKI